ncbi:MAG: signal peptidase II [Synergistaceae bacterium]|nr:signal peptidase II [Synergistaceae bacterium]
MISLAVVVICVLGEYFARTSLHEWTVYSYNTGAAFGIMGGSPDLLLWLELAANVIVAASMIFVKMRTLTRVGLSMMLGGALSNLGERFLLGHVIDWIPVPFTSLQFNLSDLCISFGALIVFLMISRNSPEGEQ